MTKTFTIPIEHLPPYQRIGEHLRHKSRFTLPSELDSIVRKFVDYHVNNKAINIPAGSKYYRARILGVGQQSPFPPQEMGAPPSGRAGPGRINPEGISYLYLAEKPETALAEVRPWKGAYVSIGQFTTEREARVVSLGGNYPIDSSAKRAKDILHAAGLSIESAIISSMYFSAPAHQEDKLAYLPSQYIAEALRSNGIDGLQYGSVLHDGGVNVVFFDSSFASCDTSKALNVKGVAYSADSFEVAQGA